MKKSKLQRIADETREQSIDWSKAHRVTFPHLKRTPDAQFRAGGCSNCGEDGEVSVMVPCPECKGPQGLTLHDNAALLLRVVREGIKVKKDDAFALKRWQTRATLVLSRLGL